MALATQAPKKLISQIEFLANVAWLYQSIAVFTAIYRATKKEIANDLNQPEYWGIVLWQENGQ